MSWIAITSRSDTDSDVGDLAESANSATIGHMKTLNKVFARATQESASAISPYPPKFELKNMQPMITAGVRASSQEHSVSLLIIFRSTASKF